MSKLLNELFSFPDHISTPKIALRLFNVLCAFLILLISSGIVTYAIFKLVNLFI